MTLNKILVSALALCYEDTDISRYKTNFIPNCTSEIKMLNAQ